MVSSAPTMAAQLGDMVDTIILESVEIIAARKRAGIEAVPKRYEELQSFADLAIFYQALAFDLEAIDPWMVLGVPKREGPSPTKDLIEHRARDATLLASMAKASWPQGDLELARKLPEKFSLAKDMVLKELPQVLRDRKKLSPDKSIPVHLEASPELLLECLRHGGHVATQLSNLQGIKTNTVTVPDNAKLLSVGDARHLYQEFAKGMVEAKNALKSFQGDAITLWAPTDNRHLQHILGALWEAAVTQEFQVHVKLLIPHPPFPGCISPGLLMDLWTHPSLGGKWKKVLANVIFLRQATRCVFSGAYGPMHHLKSIAIATFSTSEPYTGMTFSDWLPTLATFENSPAIWLDGNASLEILMRQAIHKATLPGLIRIDGPKKSYGSSREEERITFALVFDSSSTSELDIRLFIQALREVPEFQDMILGSK